MTYPAPDELPYDAWFDPNYKYNPLDSMPIATDEPMKEEDKKKENVHEKMYKIATAKYNPFAVGGSENIQELSLIHI